MQGAATTVILILFVVSMIVVERVLSLAERKAKADAEAGIRAAGEATATMRDAKESVLDVKAPVHSGDVAGDLFNLAQNLGRPVAAEGSAGVGSAGVGNAGVGNGGQAGERSKPGPS